MVGTQIISTKALGVIPVTKLSGGAKTLLLLQHEKNIFLMQVLVEIIVQNGYLKLQKNLKRILI